jgi:hypothetical protein
MKFNVKIWRFSELISEKEVQFENLHEASIFALGMYAAFQETVKIPTGIEVKQIQ